MQSPCAVAVPAIALRHCPQRPPPGATVAHESHAATRLLEPALQRDCRPLRNGSPLTPQLSSGACGPSGQQLQGHGTISFSADQYTNDATCTWSLMCRLRETVAVATVTQLDTEANFDFGECEQLHALDPCSVHTFICSAHILASTAAS